MGTDRTTLYRSTPTQGPFFSFCSPADTLQPRGTHTNLAAKQPQPSAGHASRAVSVQACVAVETAQSRFRDTISGGLCRVGARNGCVSGGASPSRRRRSSTTGRRWGRSMSGGAALATPGSVLGTTVASSSGARVHSLPYTHRRVSTRACCGAPVFHSLFRPSLFRAAFPASGPRPESLGHAVGRLGVP